MRSSRVVRNALFLASTLAASTVLSPTASADDVEVIAYLVLEDTTLTADAEAPFWFLSDDVTLDCQGHAIRAVGARPQADGIQIRGRHNIRIRNCTLIGWQTGIRVHDSSGIRVLDSTFDLNGDGVDFNNSSAIEVSGSFFHRHGDDAVDLDGVTGGFVEGNVMEDSSEDGIVLDQGTRDLIVRFNTVRNNRRGIWVKASATANTITDNLLQCNRQIDLLVDGIGNEVRDNNQSC